MGTQYLLRLLICILVLSPISALAFPDNGVLENFTGTDGTSPPNANWTGAELTNGSAGLNIRSNAAAPGGTGGYWGAYYNVQTFGPNAEAYATIINTGSTAFGAPCARLTSVGTATTNGYCVDWADGSSAINIIRLDATIATSLSTITQTITTTDKVGISAIGSQICAWFSDNGGAWTNIGCATDATYSAAGYIGLYLNGTTTVGAMDDFGGGTIGSSSQMRRRALQ